LVFMTAVMEEAGGSARKGKDEVPGGGHGREETAGS
jgi:hypothetical protein